MYPHSAGYVLTYNVVLTFDLFTFEKEQFIAKSSRMV